MATTKDIESRVESAFVTYGDILLDDVHIENANKKTALVYVERKDVDADDLRTHIEDELGDRIYAIYTDETDGGYEFEIVWFSNSWRSYHMLGGYAVNNPTESIRYADGRWKTVCGKRAFPSALQCNIVTSTDYNNYSATYHIPNCACTQDVCVDCVNGLHSG